MSWIDQGDALAAPKAHNAGGLCIGWDAGSIRWIDDVCPDFCLRADCTIVDIIGGSLLEEHLQQCLKAVNFSLILIRLSDRA